MKYESKYTAAKKVLKKQLKVNTKVVFDEDGLVCYIDVLNLENYFFII